MAVQVYVVAALMASASALIVPMKKPDGTVDLESVHTHILLLEQKFAILAKASEVETLKSKVRTLKSETRRQIQAVNATVVETRSAVQEANVYSKSNVAFEVSNEKVGHTVQAYQIFKFDAVTLNNGGGYHAPTGVFEAPVSGTYLFWANISPKAHIHVILYKEGTQIAVAFASDSTSLTYATEVKKGEKVWFQSFKYASEIWHVRHSTYGGALIHEHSV
uniref:C1q domain containing protein 3 n=1 Tax=Haliotis discus discus TaxID=91233 RepID=A0A141BGQ6_HALDI|nr:C1q domain containing protein 3 [Haliotis discus discus]